MSAGANAKKAAAAKRPHLSDLFKVGEVVTVKDSEGSEYRIFVRRPSPLQMEKAREHANGRMGRHKRDANDPNSDVRIAMVSALEEQTREELIESRSIFDAPETREQAFNEVLYDPDIGDDWETDDRYVANLTAMAARIEDIERFNKEMKESGAEESVIDEEEDEELSELIVAYDLFQAQVDKRSDELLDERITERGDKSDEDLRADIMKVTNDLESKMIWYEAYQVKMLFFACRYADDQKKLYFSDPGDVLEIPQYIRAQLYDAYERLEAGSDDVKNSLSLHNS